jgi:glycine/D-amino acid oxidase-like deaminating enzyme
LLLQQAGKKCIITEAKTIGFGTSGGTTAHLNTFMDSPYNELSKNFGEDNAQLVYTSYP